MLIIQIISVKSFLEFALFNKLLTEFFRVWELYFWVENCLN